MLKAKRFVEALRIFDAIVEFPDQDLDQYCNPLWAVQNDNTGLPLDAVRARRYLAACLPHGRSNPPIHLNAAGVLVELGDHDAAIQQLLLARAGKVELAAHLDEPLFRVLKSHARWEEVVGPPASVEEPSLLELAAAAVEAAHAVPALLLAWRKTRSPRLANLLDHLGRIGYGAEWIETALRERPEELTGKLLTTTRTLRDGRGGYAQRGETGGIWLMQECDDPRFVTALLRILKERPAQKARKRVMEAWQLAFDMVAGAGDLRAIDPLDTIAAHGSSLPGLLGEWLQPHLVQTVDSLLGQATPPPFTEGDAAFCEALERRLGIAPPAAAPPRGPRAPQRIPSEPDVAIGKLERALAALDEGGTNEAVAQLLAAWQLKRNPRLAEVVDLASVRNRLPARDDPGQEVWLELAQRGRPEELPRLLAALVCADDAPASAERLWALQGRNDPRVATALAAMLDSPPFLLPRENDNGVEEFWTAVMKTLTGLADARSVEPLAAFAARVRSLTVEVDAEAEADMYMKSPIGPFLEYQLGQVAKEVSRRDVPQLSDEEERLVSRLEAELAPEAAARSEAIRARDRETQRRQDFLLAIAEHPEDDAPRLAYATWLEERGDPYGEFIRLQITDAPDPFGREAELLEKGAVAWLHELGVVARAPRYQRGFPTMLIVDDEALAKVVGHPGWATVERIEFASGCHDEETMAALLKDPVMRSLREVRRIPAGVLIELTRHRAPPYHRLGFEPQSIEGWEPFLAALDQLPQLTTLELDMGRRDYQLFPELFQSPVAKKIRRLLLIANAPVVWMPFVATIEETAIESLEVREESPIATFDFALCFNRDRDGRLSRLEVTHGDDRSYRMSALLQQLLRLPATTLTQLTLVPHPAQQPTGFALEELRHVLARFPRLTQVSLPEPKKWSEVAAPLFQRVRDANDHGAGEAARLIAEHRSAEAATVLAECLASTHLEQLRLSVVFALSYVADASSVPALQQALRRPQERSAQMAALILGSLGAREAAADLVGLLEQTQIDDAPTMIMHALAMLGEASTVPAIHRCLERELGRKGPRPLRRAAILALGILGDEGARERAIQMLTTSDIYDQRAAATTLGLVGNAGDWSLLENRFEKPYPQLAGRLLLARTLLSPDLSPEDAQSLLGFLSLTIGFYDELAHPLGVGASLLALAERARRAEPAWRTLATGVIEYCHQSSEQARAALTDANVSFTWNVPTMRYWISLCEKISRRWAE
jgi:uncharacterized protein (TIGR02996 family)